MILSPLFNFKVVAIRFLTFSVNSSRVFPSAVTGRTAKCNCRLLTTLGLEAAAIIGHGGFN